MAVHLNFIEEITAEEEALNCSDSTAQMVETINSCKAALQEYCNFNLLQEASTKLELSRKNEQQCSRWQGWKGG